MDFFIFSYFFSFQIFLAQNQMLHIQLFVVTIHFDVRNWLCDFSEHCFVSLHFKFIPISLRNKNEQVMA